MRLLPEQGIYNPTQALLPRLNQRMVCGDKKNLLNTKEAFNEC